MNIIVDLLPDAVEIGGTEYPINTDFRISILFEMMMQDNSISDADKTRQAIELYYPTKPHDLGEAAEKIIWFYRCGKELNQTRNQSERDSGTEQKSIYSFEHDDEYIYAAFLSQYGIDLQDVEGLHWWKFRAMFKALDENCEFVKIMGYRSTKISSKMSKEQKAFYKRMQTIHALPLPEDEREKEDAITQALLNGGDLSGLLE